VDVHAGGRRLAPEHERSSGVTLEGGAQGWSSGQRSGSSALGAERTGGAWVWSSGLAPEQDSAVRSEAKLGISAEDSAAWGETRGWHTKEELEAT
jgi:hypothetical protein